MTETTLTFRFLGKSSNLISEIKRLNEELKRTKAASKEVGEAGDNRPAIASTKTLGGSVTELASKYFLVLQALQAVMGVGKAAYGALIQQNVELQQQLLGTQSSLAATNDVFANGIKIQDPTEAIQALEGPVNAAVERIRKGSLDLVGVTSKDLIPIFQNIAGQSANIGANLDQSADLALKIAAAMGTQNIPLEQQRQEINSILQANITSDSILAKTLGITNEQVRAWKQQRIFVDELNKRLEVFSAGNKLAAQSIGGIASNIQEVFDNITLEAGADLTATLAQDLNTIYKLLTENKDEILAFVQSGTDAISSLIGGVKDVGGSILSDGKPAFEQLGGAIANAAGIVENLLLGFGNLLKFGGAILGSPIVTWPLELAKNALFGLQAIASLNGQFGQATEAAEIYRQQSARAADEAINALAKTKKGDQDAAQARKNAIASLDTQIKTLQESNLVGTENRDVIRGQINELEGLKTKLAGAGSNIKLVAKDTQQLTSDLKLLNEQFDAQGKSAELATAKLTAAVKRARVGSANESATSARDEQTLLYQIEQEGLNARLKLAQDKQAGIAAIAAKGGDAEQQKEFAKQLTAAQLEGAKLEGEIAEKILARKKAIQDLQLKDLEIYQAQANDAIAQSETALQLQTEKNYQRDLTQKQRYELEKLGITQVRIEGEIRAENERTQALSKLKFDDPDEREANEVKIRASKQKTAALTLKQLENQRQIEQGIAELQIKQISDRAAAEKRNNDERIRILGQEKTQIDQITQSIERQNRLRSAQNDLAKAQTSLLETGASIQASALDRALELRKKLNDETTSPAVKRVLQQQLEALTGNRNTNEVQILQRKFALEQNIAQIKALALADEQAAARNALAIETQRNELAAKRAIIEARIAETNAKTALGEARKNLAELQKTPGADPNAIAQAQQAIKEAESNVGQASGTVQAAQSDLEQQKTLAPLAERTLAAQQASALAQQQAAEYARQQAAQLTIVEAKSRAIAEGQKGVRFEAQDFAKIQAPKTPLNTGIYLGDSGQKTALPALDSGKAEEQRQLQIRIMQDSLVQLTRLANREPARPAVVQQVQSSRGTVLRGTGL